MHNYKAAFAVALSIALTSPAAGQLKSAERYKAEQLARIQAKADAEEQARQRRSRLESAKSACQGPYRTWDYANEACVESRFFRRPKH